jgi:hypothetical protein
MPSLVHNPLACNLQFTWHADGFEPLQEHERPAASPSCASTVRNTEEAVMKKQLFALLGLGLLLLTASAYAQTVNLKAKVPFNFVLSGRTLPSGEYTLQSLESVDHALVIRGADQKASIFLSNTCASLNASERTKLIFARYGNQYFLSQIWMAGNNTGYQLPKSHREIEVARNSTVEKVIVLAALR